MTNSGSGLPANQPIIIALDYTSKNQALNFASSVTPDLCKLKVGKELFARAGPDLVAKLINAGFDVFLDLKFHDIPKTTAQAVLAAADMGVWMVNVHASGGSRMMLAARQALEKHQSITKLVAVTVLTSIGQNELIEVGVYSTVKAQVQRLAGLARDCGLDGVVCSADEAESIVDLCGQTFLRVTPGIRLSVGTISRDDQQRISEPAQALKAGSNYLVIGRPVTRADDPLATLLVIHQQIKQYYSVESNLHNPY